MVEKDVNLMLDEELLNKIDAVVDSGRSPFSSRSALIEYFLKKADLSEWLTSEISIDLENLRKAKS